MVHSVGEAIIKKRFSQQKQMEPDLNVTRVTEWNEWISCLGYKALLISLNCFLYFSEDRGLNVVAKKQKNRPELVDAFRFDGPDHWPGVTEVDLFFVGKSCDHFNKATSG